MNVKKNIKFVFYVIALAVPFVLGYFFNRRRVSGNNDSLGELGKGITAAGKNNQQLGEGIERAEKATEDIRKHNQSARKELQSAKNILEEARKRAGL